MRKYVSLLTAFGYFFLLAIREQAACCLKWINSSVVPGFQRHSLCILSVVKWKERRWGARVVLRMQRVSRGLLLGSVFVWLLSLLLLETSAEKWRRSGNYVSRPSAGAEERWSCHLAPAATSHPRVRSQLGTGMIMRGSQVERWYFVLFAVTLFDDRIGSCRRRLVPPDEPALLLCSPTTTCAVLRGLGCLPRSRFPFPPSALLSWFFLQGVSQLKVRVARRNRKPKLSVFHPENAPEMASLHPTSLPWGQVPARSQTPSQSLSSYIPQKDIGVEELRIKYGFK